MARKKEVLTPMPGDVVYLKSGSPRMTVIAVEGGMATCLWNRYGTTDLHREEIPVLALKVTERFDAPEHDPETGEITEADYVPRSR